MIITWRGRGKHERDWKVRGNKGRLGEGSVRLMEVLLDWEDLVRLGES